MTRALLSQLQVVEIILSQRSYQAIHNLKFKYQFMAMLPKLLHKRWLASISFLKCISQNQFVSCTRTKLKTMYVCTLYMRMVRCTHKFSKVSDWRRTRHLRVSPLKINGKIGLQNFSILVAVIWNWTHPFHKRLWDWEQKSKWDFAMVLCL